MIGDSANHASIELHRAASFAAIGTILSVGYKFGRCVDNVPMQRSLGASDGTPP